MQNQRDQRETDAARRGADPKAGNPGQGDDPRQANESGEPAATGRQHGRPVDAQQGAGGAEGTGNPSGRGGEGPAGREGGADMGADVPTSQENWESGRQRSMED